MYQNTSEWIGGFVADSRRLVEVLTTFFIIPPPKWTKYALGILIFALMLIDLIARGECALNGTRMDCALQLSIVLQGVAVTIVDPRVHLYISPKKGAFVACNHL